MPFLIISNADIYFTAQDLQWRSYTTRNILLTTKQIELLGKKEFAATTFDLEHKAIIVYVATLSVDLGDKVYPLRKA